LRPATAEKDRRKKTAEEYRRFTNNSILSKPSRFLCVHFLPFLCG
jgi:hypothetical protein